MANTTTDKRQVRIEITRSELTNLLAGKAKEVGLIDFDPDTTEVIDQGAESGFEIVFEKSLVPETPPA